LPNESGVIVCPNPKCHGKIEEKKKEIEKHPVKPAEDEVKGPSACPHHFGYLANRPKNASIPQECLICSKIVKCMLKLSDT
jgi:hypothetical protein